MSESNKTIAVSFKSDSTSFQNLKSQIDQLTTALEKLAKAANGISGGGLKGMSGGGLLSGVNVATAPSGSTQGKQQQGIAGILTQGLTVDRNLFRTISEGSKEALKAMTDALKKNVDEQTAQMKKLKSEIDSLAKSYNQLSNTGGLGSNLQSSTAAEMIAKGKQLQQVQGNIAQSKAAMGEGGGMMGMLGRGMSVAAPYLAVAGAAIGAYGYAANQYYEQRDANLSWQVGKRDFYGGVAGGIGSTIGGLAQQVRGGDLARADAFARLAKRGDFNTILGQGNRKARELLAFSASGDTSKLGDISSNYTQEFGADLVRGIQGGDEDSIRRAKDIAKTKALAMIPLEQSKQMANAVNNAVAMDPLREARMNAFYANAHGNLSLQRAFGVSSIGKGGVWTDQAARMTDLANSLGYEGGEAGGAVSSAGMQVGRANRFKGLSFLSRQYGGMGNAAEVFGAGQMYGSGDALLNTIAGRGGIGGRGGLDALTASRVGSMVAGQMQGSGYGFDGIGLSQGLGSVIGTAGTVGGQLRLANQLGMGMNAEGRSLAGTDDGFGSITNAYAGSKAFGGNFQAMEAVRKMNPGDMITALRTGKVSERMARSGVTLEGLKQYAENRDQFTFSRYIDSGFGTGNDKTAASVRNAGGPMAYLNESLKGLKGKARADKFLELTGQMGSALAFSTGGSDEESIGQLRARSAGELGVTDAISGKGIWDPTSKDDPARKAMAEKGKIAVDDAKKLEADRKSLEESIGSLTPLSNELRDFGTHLINGEKRLTASFGRLADFINKKFPGILGEAGTRGDETPEKAAPKSSINIESGRSSARQLKSGGGM